ncbi:hypothetical protein, partial [Klebsiella aerogenes]|uniref:hypothetical protein n=1 Tax=Klebsiella aerogenes TaxID=548 RepID=UPI0019533490
RALLHFMKRRAAWSPLATAHGRPPRQRRPRPPLSHHWRLCTAMSRSPRCWSAAGRRMTMPIARYRKLG